MLSNHKQDQKLEFIAMNYKKYFDNYILGILLSIISPLSIYFMFFAERFSEYRVLGDQFIEFMKIVLPIAISRCIFPNFVFFIIFISFNYYKSVRGVLYTSLALTIILYIIKYLF